MSKIIYTLHITFGLAFILIGYGGVQKKLPLGLYPFLLGLSVVILVYHSWKLLSQPKNIGPIHDRTPREIFYLLIVIGILAVSYHGKKLHRSFKIEVI